MGQLRKTNIHVLFETEKTDSRLKVSVIETFAQVGNEENGLILYYNVHINKILIPHTLNLIVLGRIATVAPRMKNTFLNGKSLILCLRLKF